MIAAIKRCWEWNVWVIRIGWLNGCDRWFIFRDAPLHVVARFAAWEDDGSPIVQSVIDQARAELGLRCQQMRREILVAAGLDPS